MSERTKYLEELYNFYKSVSKQKLQSLEHFVVMNKGKTDKEIYDLWHTMKKVQKLLKEQK